MKKPLVWLCLVVVGSLGAAVVAAEPDRPLPIEVHFAPEGGCTDAILRELRAAKSTVLVQAYWFTSAPIAKALVETHQRGVQVKVILDKSRMEKDHTQADYLLHMGVPTLVDGKHVTAHNKVILVDGKVVITGSFNFTEQSEKQNAENLLVIRDPTLAAKFVANWKAHAEHSVPYQTPVSQ